MMNSKKTFITALFILFVATAFAQTKPSAPDCYGEWYTLFRERGAKPIPDGTQEIIISLRKDGYSQCFVGKVDVAAGKLKFPVLVAKDDGTFEPLSAQGLKLDQASLASPDALTSITDGMSITVYTPDGESVKLFFYKFLNDSPKKNKVAPSPSTLIKK